MSSKRESETGICVEHLEHRRLMSVSVSGGRLTISGTGGSDRIDVDQNATTIFVREQREQASVVLTPVLASLVNRIRITGSSGHDRITLSASVRVGADVSGDTGNDTISGSPRNDTLRGGGGDDSISGNSGDDRIEGGTGHDNLAGNSGNDNVGGNDGNDTVSGGFGRDTLVGGSGNDRLFAKDFMDDVVDGGTGFDAALYDSQPPGSVFGGHDKLISIEARIV
jgi:Ca2+-binding RTX toxin-like protein